MVNCSKMLPLPIFKNVLVHWHTTHCIGVKAPLFSSSSSGNILVDDRPLIVSLGINWAVLNLPGNMN